MADPSALGPPLDPSQYPAYLDMQRKQQIASMLMGAFQQSNNSPSPVGAAVGPYQVQARRPFMQNIAPILTAALAGKAQNSSLQAQQNYFNPKQPAQPAPYDATAAAQAPSGIAQPAPGPGSPTATPGAAPSGLVAPQNPMVPPGMSLQQASALAMQPGGREALAKAAIERAQASSMPTDLDKKLNSAGITDPNLRHQIIQASLAKENYMPPTLVKGNETALDPTTRQPFFTGPTESGVLTNWDGSGNPSVSNAPGALAANQAQAAAKTSGAEANKPIKLGTDANGRDIYGFPTPPGPNAPARGGTGGVSGGASTASPAVLTGQEAGAKAGQEYSTELSKNSTGATEVRRSLSELRNLAGQATPAATNDAKSRIGAMMIAAGSDPETVSKYLGVDTGALQAAQKQTATLAVNTIHSMTSRGTNFDLDTFMRNNPNLNLSDPGSFNRVADYMDQKAQQEIAKQKDFTTWKKGVSPDDWESGHTAHWNEIQNQMIDKGASNSKRPAPPGTTLPDLLAEQAARTAMKSSYGAKPGGW